MLNAFGNPNPVTVQVSAIPQVLLKVNGGRWHWARDRPSFGPQTALGGSPG
ncbi:hypothetical protein H6F48_17930 [Limnothrix sp. FACHB-1088]|nr:hypothetical protein [Limnothrix sp. FACHB-1088]